MHADSLDGTGAALLVLYLTKTKRIHRSMSALQAFQSALSFLSTTNFKDIALNLFAAEEGPRTSLSLEQTNTNDAAVMLLYLDQNATSSDEQQSPRKGVWYNCLWRVTESAISQLQQAAATALSVLYHGEGTNGPGIDHVFLTSTSFFEQYDMYLRLPVVCVEGLGRAVGETIDPSRLPTTAWNEELRENVGDRDPWQITSLVVLRVLTRALGDRVRSVHSLGIPLSPELLDENQHRDVGAENPWYMCPTLPSAPPMATRTLALPPLPPLSPFLSTALNETAQSPFLLSAQCAGGYRLRDVSKRITGNLPLPLLLPLRPPTLPEPLDGYHRNPLLTRRNSAAAEGRAGSTCRGLRGRE